MHGQCITSTRIVPKCIISCSGIISSAICILLFEGMNVSVLRFMFFFFSLSLSGSYVLAVLDFTIS